MERNKIFKHFKLIGFSFVLLTGVCTWLVLPQQTSTQDRQSSSNKDTKVKEMNLAEQIAYFNKRSSTQVETDGENKIVAVRRLNIIVDDIDGKGNPIKRKIPYVEIELFSRMQPPATNSAHLVQIGDQEFHVGGRGCEEIYGCIMVVVSLKQFESLKDSALITYRIGNPVKPESLKEAYKNGEPKEVIGSKFGRLDKKMIDKFPTVERNAVQQ